MSNYFLEFLNQIVPLSDECRAAINDITIKRQVPKGSQLLNNGDVCREFHFIERGIARAFYYKDGKDVTAWFAAENQIISAIDSLFAGKPSMYNIEALEDSIIWSLQYGQIEPVFQAFPEVERLGRILVTKNYLLLDERMKSFVFSNAEGRYESLLEVVPGILNRTKLGHVASYIGVTQETLSRIRSSYKSSISARF
ncbi:Crp/Fnr family transcriptional regulator [Dyadobacter sp. 32]|uniref:Crp/Fnr family transcriptional regulator n=1 Tax=Dyadobacter sp. 32 TaxID=538966 RepID=UPI0011EE744D